MDYSDKIKALQEKAGVEQDGIISSKTWLALHKLLCTDVPYDINLSSVIKAIQHKLNVRVTGYSSTKTLDALYELLIENIEAEESSNEDPLNEVILKSMTKEVVPFAKELVRLAAEKGIYIRLMSCTADDAIDKQKEVERKIRKADACDHDFGLVFSVSIYERMANGDYIYKNSSSLYQEVAKLGESIGLTWAGDRKTFSNLQLFELRPAWAVCMQEMEMLKELCRRKKENINLLAIL